jgi:hypothetical protein
VIISGKEREAKERVEERTGERRFISRFGGGE